MRSRCFLVRRFTNSKGQTIRDLKCNQERNCKTRYTLLLQLAILQPDRLRAIDIEKQIKADGEYGSYPAAFTAHVSIQLLQSPAGERIKYNPPSVCL